MTGIGQFRLPSTCGAEPAKSKLISLAVDRDRDPQRDRGSVRRLERVRRLVGAVGEPPDRGAAAALGVVEDGRHAVAEPVLAVAIGELGEAAARRAGWPPAAPAGRRGAGRVGASGSASSARPASSIRRGSITTPSSSRLREPAGMPPGVGPPMSAWWARLAAQPICPPSPNSGEISVMSGRWVPPLNGSLRIQSSSGLGPPRWRGERRDGLDGGGHRAEVDGDVLGLHDELGVGVEERGRAVPALLDVRRVGGPDQDRAHLVADRAQAAGEDLELDRVDVPCAVTRPLRPVGRRAPRRSCRSGRRSRASRPGGAASSREGRIRTGPRP